MNWIPRVLTYGQPFNELSGGGITISNLFRGWPKANLASCFVAWNEPIVSFDVCENHYVIGNDEHYWRFPLNYFKKPFPDSGTILNHEKTIVRHNIYKKGRKLLSGYFNPIFHWLGIYHVASRIVLSEKQKKWILIFKPDLLYLQVSTLEGICFANQLIEFCSVPAVLHMMDDWPSTLGRSGPLSFVWKQKVNKEFAKLLVKVDKCLTISEDMGYEFQRRYSKRCVTFHNPVHLTHTMTINHKNRQTDRSTFNILYIGRIGTANKSSILTFAKTVCNIIIDGKTLHFHIRSRDILDADLAGFRTSNTIHLSNAVPHSQVASLMLEFDLLLLPLDFTKKAMRFSQYSLPTKATEYMVSGVPTLVFAPEKTAVSRFFKENNCGFCLTINSPKAVFTMLNDLILNEEMRKQIAHNAKKIAIEKFDAIKIRRRFKQVMTETAAIGNYEG